MGHHSPPGARTNPAEGPIWRLDPGRARQTIFRRSAATALRTCLLPGAWDREAMFAPPRPRRATLVTLLFLIVAALASRPGGERARAIRLRSTPPALARVSRAADDPVLPEWQREVMRARGRALRRASATARGTRCPRSERRSSAHATPARSTTPCGSASSCSAATTAATATTSGALADRHARRGRGSRRSARVRRCAPRRARRVRPGARPHDRVRRRVGAGTVPQRRVGAHPERTAPLATDRGVGHAAVERRASVANATTRSAIASSSSAATVRSAPGTTSGSSRSARDTHVDEVLARQRAASRALTSARSTTRGPRPARRVRRLPRRPVR